MMVRSSTCCCKNVSCPRWDVEYIVRALICMHMCNKVKMVEVRTMCSERTCIYYSYIFNGSDRTLEWWRRMDIDVTYSMPTLGSVATPWQHEESFSIGKVHLLSKSYCYHLGFFVLCILTSLDVMYRSAASSLHCIQDITPIKAGKPPIVVHQWLVLVWALY